MDKRLNWNTIKFSSNAFKEFKWTKKIKSVNEISFWR